MILYLVCNKNIYSVPCYLIYFNLIFSFWFLHDAPTSLLSERQGPFRASLKTSKALIKLKITKLKNELKHCNNDSEKKE